MGSKCKVIVIVEGWGFSHLAAAAISPFLTTNQYKNDLTFIKSEMAKKPKYISEYASLSQICSEKMISEYCKFETERQKNM